MHLAGPLNGFGSVPKPWEPCAGVGPKSGVAAVQRQQDAWCDGVTVDHGPHHGSLQPERWERWQLTKNLKNI